MGLGKWILKAVFTPPKKVRVERWENGVTDIRDERGRAIGVADPDEM